MNLNELRNQAYRNAVVHGWHEENLSDEHFLCLVISELMEAVEADRKGIKSQAVRFNKDMDYLIHEFKLYGEKYDKAYIEIFNRYIKDSVEDELADAVIRILDYCGTINFTIDDSCADDEVIEEFSHVFKDKTFTESIFNIVTSITRFEIQIAFLKILGLCKYHGIDIMWHIEQKMKYNELRPYKHGDKSY